MFRMFRIRRYRVFVILALVTVVLLVKFTNTIRGYGFTKVDGLNLSSPPKAEIPPLRTSAQGKSEEKLEGSQRSTAMQNPTSASTRYAVQPTSFSATVKSAVESKATLVPTIPAATIPDRKVGTDKGIAGEEAGTDDIHPIGPPGRQELPSFGGAPTTIHWEKPIVNFPVPTESIIQLPVGSPASIPKIQHKFDDETPDAKINREKRQAKVKEEFKKAWAGYKQFAWLHDELSPKTGKFRDPFCGWAATLVDTLDTLWIMGLQEEFEDAARAVDQIDFTTSPRGDIPVFETTIRYLGGLLAAYDVSEGKYKNLLDKAVELGEILMGAFDTPNRMPILYYRWKPAFASQPHRASQRSNLAELGSLSVEFTRLAQLTKDSRYYDAVARVTDALSEYQDRGTKLGSVFPNSVDASGCNRSVPLNVHEPVAKLPETISLAGVDQPAEGYKPHEPPTVAEPRKGSLTGEPDTWEMEIVPDELSKVHISGREEHQEVGESGNLKRELPQMDSSNTTSPLATDPITDLPIDLPGAKSRIGDNVGDWDCIPQGLDSSTPYGRDTFSMGGGQDSTYEYFPKQYLLLAGREEKYKKLYLKTIEDVRKWMLYRPMVPDNSDILFSGAVTTLGNPETDLVLVAEVEHLTCFIGGMIGMGSQIFDLEGDLELAKKLTDGCVWAYGSTPTGIMPEGATVMACKSAEHCTWNETAYFRYLDPMADERKTLVEQYDANKKVLAEEAEAQSRLGAEKAATAKAEADAHPISVPDVKDGDLDAQTQDTPPPEDNSKALESVENEPRSAKDPVSLQKRQTSGSTSQTLQDAVQVRDSPDESVEKAYDQKSLSTEAELLNTATTGRQAEIGSEAEAALTLKEEVLVDPLRPLTHKEFVDARIKQGALPPGFVGIRGRKYILRPEAIESVWYMYRITGDATWQDKGWTMFEAVIKATSSTYGHSAIYDVTVSEDKPFQIDEMESFWLAETLKYFYLLYSTPDTISLDDWVLNTEAHPFKREQ